MPTLQTKSIQNSQGFFKSSFVRSAAYVPPGKRTFAQQIGAVTFGQTIGGALGILSLGKLVWNIIKQEGESIWSKYIFPIVGTLLGALVAGSNSQINKDVFASDLLRTGISNVLEKIQKLGNVNLFSRDDISSANDMLKRMGGASRKIVTKAFEEIKKKSGLEDNLDSPDFYNTDEQGSHSAEEVKRLEKFYNLLLNAQETERNAIYRMYGPLPPKPKNGEDKYSNERLFQGDLKTFQTFVSQALKKAGVEIEFHQDREGKIVKILIPTNDLYDDESRPGVKFKPCIVLAFPSEVFEVIRSDISKDFSSILNRKTTPSKEKEFVSELNMDVLLALRDKLVQLGVKSVGYIEINDKTKTRQLIPVHGSILDFLPQRSLEKFGSWVESSTQHLADNSVPIGYTLDTATPTFELPSTHRRADVPARESGTQAPPEIKSDEEQDIEKLKNDVFKYFNFDFNVKDEPEEVTRLKVCLVKAYAYKKIKELSRLKKTLSETDVQRILENAVLNELKNKVKLYSQWDEDNKIDVDIDTGKLPEDLLREEYFEKAIKSMNRPGDSHEAKKGRLTSLISDEQKIN